MHDRNESKCRERAVRRSLSCTPKGWGVGVGGNYSLRRSHPITKCHPFLLGHCFPLDWSCWFNRQGKVHRGVKVHITGWLFFTLKTFFLLEWNEQKRFKISPWISSLLLEVIIFCLPERNGVTIFARCQHAILYLMLNWLQKLAGVSPLSRRVSFVC